MSLAWADTVCRAPVSGARVGLSGKARIFNPKSQKGEYKEEDIPGDMQDAYASAYALALPVRLWGLRGRRL